MARNIEFNQQKAIAAATECFWQKGYAATSLKDLLAAMSISRSSFYNSFVGKQEMFELCLAQYSARVESVCCMVLGSKADKPWQAIEQFLSMVLLQIPQTMKAKGCLLVNTLAETAEVDEALKQQALTGLAAVKQSWWQALLNEPEFNQLEQAEQQQIIEQLFSLLLGWRLQSQAGLSDQILQQQISNSIRQLQTYSA